MRKFARSLVAAWFVVLALVLSGGTASAATPGYYYLGGSGNAVTQTQTTSYSPYGKFAGYVNSGTSFYISNCQGTSTQCAEPLIGFSSKLYWRPCVGWSDITPRCNFASAALELRRIQFIDIYGNIVKAEPTNFRPTIFADDANGDPTGANYYFLPHVAGNGNIDYVRSSAGQSYAFTTTWESGTWGFTTQVPLTWSPKICYVFDAIPNVLYSTRWNYSVCSPLYPH
jgi:hypothetical protein